MLRQSERPVSQPLLDPLLVMDVDLPGLLAVTALVMAAPGPSVLYAVTQRVQRGRLAGAVAVLGLESGLLVHVLAACLGISALIAASPTLLAGLRLVGAGYLAVLGLGHLGFGRRRPVQPPLAPATLVLGRWCQTPTYCAAPENAPGCVGIVADETPLSESSAALPGTPSGTCSLRPACDTTLRAARPGRLDLWRVYRSGVLVDLLNPKSVLFFLALLPQFVPTTMNASTGTLVVAGVVGLGLLFDGGYAALAGRLHRRIPAAVRRWGSPVAGCSFLALAGFTILG